MTKRTMKRPSIAAVMAGVLVVLALITAAVVWVTLYGDDRPRFTLKGEVRHLSIPEEFSNRATKSYHVKECMTVKHDPGWTDLPDWMRSTTIRTEDAPLYLGGGVRSAVWVRFRCDGAKSVDDYSRKLATDRGEANIKPEAVWINNKEGRMLDYEDGNDRKALFYVASSKRVCVAEYSSPRDSYDRYRNDVLAAVNTMTCE